MVDGDGVDVVYQPIFDLRDGTPVGAEALCRFQVAPLRSPDVWFAEAAEVGLGIELEIAALRLAFRGLDRLDGSIAMGVNVSPETCCSSDLRALLEDAAGRQDRLGDHRARSGRRLRGAQGRARSPAGTRRRARHRRHVFGIREPATRPEPPARRDQAGRHAHARDRDGRGAPIPRRSARAVRPERGSDDPGRRHRNRRPGAHPGRGGSAVGAGILPGAAGSAASIRDLARPDPGRGPDDGRSAPPALERINILAWHPTRPVLARSRGCSSWHGHGRPTIRTTRWSRRSSGSSGVARARSRSWTSARKDTSPGPSEPELLAETLSVRTRRGPANWPRRPRCLRGRPRSTSRARWRR